MSYCRYKWLFEAFALAARDAAGRFVRFRANARRSRHSWRPLVLRWRQSRNRQKNVQAGRMASTANVHWFPQFHFHFATKLHERTRLDRLPGSFPAAGILERRVVQDQHWTILQAATPTLEPRRLRPPRRVMYGRVDLKSAINIGPNATPGEASRKTVHSIEPRVANRPRQLVFERMPGVFRKSTQKDELLQPFQTHSRIWKHTMQIVRLSRVQHSRDPQGSRDIKVVPVQLDRPEELAWRRAIRPPPDIADNEQRQEPVDSIQRPAIRSYQGQEVATAASSPVTRAEVPQVIRLDPSVLDRLTDDVIRRVEQRARIERQRHGL